MAECKLSMTERKKKTEKSNKFILNRKMDQIYRFFNFRYTPGAALAHLSFSLSLFFALLKIFWISVHEFRFSFSLVPPAGFLAEFLQASCLDEQTIKLIETVSILESRASKVNRNREHLGT